MNTDDEIGLEFAPAHVDGAEISRARPALPFTAYASITVVPFDDHVEEPGRRYSGKNFASIIVSKDDRLRFRGE